MDDCIYSLYYATNRGHIAGKSGSQWEPMSYGKKFSSDGAENLRFGKIDVFADEREVDSLLKKRKGRIGTGDGEKLLSYFAEKAEDAVIKAFKENLDREVPDTAQNENSFGSTRFFEELKNLMDSGCDVLIFIHGFNVSWHDAVGTALSLKESVNKNKPPGEPPTEVILFSWPSDGSMMPFVAYKSDRIDARSSGGAVGRAILKVTDYFHKIKASVIKQESDFCGGEINLLCHSMGNYVLENALEKMIEHSPLGRLEPLFSNIFMCAPDVDDDTFEDGRPLERLHEIARNVTVFHNEGDIPLYISNKTKSNPKRLGHSGPARPNLINHKIKQVDCTRIVSGIVEHSYYLDGDVNAEITQLMGKKIWEFNNIERRREM